MVTITLQLEDRQSITDVEFPKTSKVGPSPFLDKSLKSQKIKLSDVKQAEADWQRAVTRSINPNVDMAVARAEMRYRELMENWEEQKRSETERSFLNKSLEDYPSKGKGERCKKGETAASSECIPASKIRTGGKKTPSVDAAVTQAQAHHGFKVRHHGVKPSPFIRYQPQQHVKGPSPEDLKPIELPPLESVPLEPPKDEHDMEDWLSKAARHPYILEAQRRLRVDHFWTSDKYQHSDGTWDPERVAAVHELIIAKFLNPKAKPPKGEKPKLVLLIGPAGAGKSTAGKRQLAELIPDRTLVNPDEVKEMIPEYQGWNGTNVHLESKHVAKEIMRRAKKAGHNVLYDGTGRDTENIVLMVEAFGRDGYDVHVAHVTIPSWKAAYRAAQRFLANPFGKRNPSKPASRYTPLEYVYKIVDGVPDQSYKQLRDNPWIKSGVSYSNDVPLGEPPVELDHFAR